MKRRTIINLTFALVLSLLLLISGCGGGSAGGNAPAPTTVTGVAAAGAVITGTVTLRDSSATPKSVNYTTTTGSFSFDVTGCTKPFLLKVQGTTADGTPYTLYSLAADTGIANLNPLGNLVVARAAADGDLAALFNSADAARLQQVAGNLTQATQEVQATLKPLLVRYNVAAVDPIKDSYHADHTGLDHLLDLVHIAVTSAGSVTISETGAATFTKDVTSGFATQTVSGSVTLDGAPFAGVTLTVADAATGTVYGSATSAADGSYQVAHVPQGSVRVTPTKVNYCFDRANSTVTVAGDLQVNPFRSYRPFSIQGTVFAANGGGRGVAGVTVTAQKSGSSAVSATTDGNGRYVIKGLMSGDYQLSLARADVAGGGQVSFTPASATRTISTASNFALADFTAGIATYTLSGSIARLTTGAAVPQVALTLVSRDNNGQAVAGLSFSATSDASGNYSFSGIPSGYYGLTLTLADAAGSWGFADLPDPLHPSATKENFQIDGADLQMSFTGWPPGTATGSINGSTR